MDNLFQEELRKFFGNIHLDGLCSCGKTRMGKINDDTIAKISFATNGNTDIYSCICVKIINKHRGEIDSHYFNFRDILQSFEDGSSPHIYLYRTEPSWHKRQPTNKERHKVFLVIDEYINLFR